jgi:hypothetical protein
VSADRVHPRDGLRAAAGRGVIPQEERDRTTSSERASSAIRAAYQRERARTLLSGDDGADQ